VWNGRLFVFGGFGNQLIEATATVDVWDPVALSWNRMSDLSRAVTHRNAQVLGDTIWFAGGFVGDNPGLATDRVEGYDPSTDTWFEGPSLPELRGGGALLADGRTLHYFGGYGGDKAVRADHWALDLDAWMADGPSWEPRAPLPRPRGHLTGAVVAGRLYAIGGADPHDPNSVDLSDVDAYDPFTDSWSAAARLPVGTSHVEPGTFVQDGRIWIVGGRSVPSRGASDRILVFDPAEDRWLQWKRLPRGLLAPVAAAFGDDLFVAGGGDENNNPEVVRAVWVASMEPGWWESDPMPRPLGEVSAGLVGNQLIVVGEGSDVTLIYDLGAGQWSGGGRPTIPRPWLGHHHAAEVVDGRFFLLGGLGEGAGQMQIYDLSTNLWTLGPELPFRAGSSVSAVIGGKIYVAGGIDGDSTIAEAAVYDPATETWTSIAPMPLPRNHAASGTDGSRWYIFGGRGPGSGDGNIVANGFDDVQVYDPESDRWIVSGAGPEAPTPLPVGRGGTGKAAYVQGLFYIMGGETLDGPGANENGVYERVDIYDPRTNLWTEGPPLPTPRHGIFPVATGNRIYLAGGGDHAGASATAAVEILELPR
jgi:N-acetylneuraminic acid mutarotase